MRAMYPEIYGDGDTAQAEEEVEPEKVEVVQEAAGEDSSDDREEREA